MNEIKSNNPFYIRTERNDGYIISTIKPSDLVWYGKYETAVFKNEDHIKKRIGCIKVVEGYSTRKEAIKGHKKYCNMTTKELERLDSID